VFGEDLVDLALPGDRLFRVDITADQILHDVAWEFFVRLVPARQGLQDDTVAQMALNLSVERIGQHRRGGTGRIGETITPSCSMLLVHVSHRDSL
jgi:hypothetical protein